MIKNIKKVAVLGSGIMGSGLACHLANVGLEVLLLDIFPKSEERDAIATRKNLSLQPSSIHYR